MFSKQHRIGKKEFDEIFKRGKTFSNEYLLLKRLESDNLAIAVAVSKKIYKSAVKRHLVKRKILAILRKNEERVSKGHLIFIVRKDLSTLSNQDLENNIFDILNKVV